ncbi:hypothetical protein D9M70_586660 [compost metagenome]
MVLARALVFGRRLGEATGPFRDGAGRVTGLFRPERGQGGAQLGGFCRGNRSQRLACGQRQGDRHTSQHVLFQHCISP